MLLSVEPHPRLALGAFEAQLPKPLGEISTPEWLLRWLSDEASAPVTRDEPIRLAVRDMLRLGGYKPTGRGKPASEYLVKAAGAGRLSSINPVVDVCNAVSLHSGLPISVIDPDRAEPPLSVAVVQGDQRYAFNAADQEIRLQGLLCLHDRSGPCANGVKDSERTKIGPGARRTLSLVWGVATAPEHTDRTVQWYRELLHRLGATTELVKRDAEMPR